MDTHPRIRVAIVGSGLAGLVSGHLLINDTHQRYAVKVFESGESLSLDAASVSIPNVAQTSAERVDVPMRAFAGGFYTNLKALYDHLGVQYRAQSFLFEFATPESTAAASRPYFVHASNLHQLAPRANGVGIMSYLVGTAFVLACYAWFSICCFLVAPTRGETLQTYLHRLWIPQRFVTYYLLPLISSVTTCPHEALLRFPASDMTEYKRRTHRAPHYAVSGGVKRVQDRLAQGIHCELDATVIAVEPFGDGVKVLWTKGSRTAGEKHTEIFDRVVLAVAPDVVGQIFEPLQHHMQRIPTVIVESVVHHDRSVLSNAHSDRSNDNGAHLIRLHTSTDNFDRTESHHVQPCGAIVTTCPISPIDPALIIQSAKFTRVLRSPESQRIVNAMLGNCRDIPIDDKSVPQWRNGDNNVWIIGGWCWDGMVLLEGCVVSAMSVAADFNVNVPWRHRQSSI